MLTLALLAAVATLGFAERSFEHVVFAIAAILLVAATLMLVVADAAARWTLTLVPRESPLSGVVERVVIDGTQAQLTRIEVDERMGDRTVLVVQPVGK